MLFLVQVTYSQTLGLIGYCLLPLVIIAPVVSLLQSYPWVAFLVKVGVLVGVADTVINRGFLNFCVVRELVCYGRHTVLALSWLRRN